MDINYHITSATDIGTDYKFIRELLHMSRKAFGKFVGVSPKTIQNLENTSKVSKKTLNKTLTATKYILNINELLYLVDAKKLDEFKRFDKKITIILGGKI